MQPLINQQTKAYFNSPPERCFHSKSWKIDNQIEKAITEYVNGVLARIVFKRNCHLLNGFWQRYTIECRVTREGNRYPIVSASNGFPIIETVMINQFYAFRVTLIRSLRDSAGCFNDSGRRLFVRGEFRKNRKFATAIRPFQILDRVHLSRRFAR